MRTEKTLSIMPYYGGKARMAKLIADMLNYDDSSIYIEPFGGACSVLLNKPPHKIEIYNDYGEGVCAVMRMLSDPKCSDEFISRLYDTEYSQEEFDRAKEIFDKAEIGIVDQYGNALESELKNVLISFGMLPADADRKKLKALLKNKEASDFLSEILANDEKKRLEFGKRLKPLLEDYEALKDADEKGYTLRPRNMGIEISDMDLAIATFVVYTQSRDAMGKAWSGLKYKSIDHYKRQIDKLYECAKRMEGVMVYQIDAMDFLRQYFGINRDEELEDIDPIYKIMPGWISSTDVMMYCDPSYIDPKDEEKLLNGINWEKEKNLSDAIKINIRNKFKNDPKNLGKAYVMSFDYRDQENFLKCICDAKCRLIVSNYDLILYNKYLTPEKNWKRMEFETKTSVGGKKDNKRVEVLWYNY